MVDLVELYPEVVAKQATIPNTGQAVALRLHSIEDGFVRHRAFGSGRSTIHLGAIVPYVGQQASKSLPAVFPGIIRLGFSGTGATQKSPLDLRFW